MKYAVDYDDDGFAFYPNLLAVKAGVSDYLLLHPDCANSGVRLYKRNSKKSIAAGNTEAFTAEFTLIQLEKLKGSVIGRRTNHWAYFDWSEVSNA